MSIVKGFRLAYREHQYCTFYYFYALIMMGKMPFKVLIEEWVVVKRKEEEERKKKKK
jgi:hypothetical protein